ncbi:hypothetical protein [Bradyrhizobium sp. URHD0069]|uniref:hypothetical protein n=1 Tax=Bradyrhizobium sp. URHD0069 TaxID=1380355 RepID=UPI00049856E8|nr:hypothetical protein [Bradyrhizobium sp. URHD0069]
MLARYIMPLFIVWLVALSGSLANAGVNSEKDKQTARSAWAKAVSLAKQRNTGNTCEADAYQSTILSEMGVAVKLSPHLRNEVVTGKSTSAKALRKALAGNLMLSDLIGEMSTPKEVARAMVGSVWYSKDGGVMGSRSILRIKKTHVRELVVDSETSKRRPVIWAYSFDAKTRELTLSNGMSIRRYTLEKASETTEYQLTISDANEVGYSSEPDDCSA